MRPRVANRALSTGHFGIRLDIGAAWSVLLAMDTPCDPSGGSNPEDALFALMLQLLERALELVVSADRGERLGELAGLAADLDLFAQAAVRGAAYQV